MRNSVVNSIARMLDVSPAQVFTQKVFSCADYMLYYVLFSVILHIIDMNTFPQILTTSHDQVLLRWALQRGHSVLPKSTRWVA